MPCKKHHINVTDFEVNVPLDVQGTQSTDRLQRADSKSLCGIRVDLQVAALSLKMNYF